MAHALPRVVGMRPYAYAPAALACLALVSSGCAIGRTPIEPDSFSDPAALAAAANDCVDRVNQLRISVGDRPLSDSGPIVSFAMDSARIDGEAHVAHKYFLDTQGGNGVATAENLIPWWKTSDWGSVQSIVRTGIDQMWAEGSGGQHYQVMRGPYTSMGCGVAAINGEVTVSLDFH